METSTKRIRAGLPIPQKVTLLRVAGLCGILCPAVTLTTIFIAISYAPWFSFTGDSLSNLAGLAAERPIWAARGTASIIFNSGLVTDGILTLLFATGLRENLQLTTRLGRLGQLLFVLGACALTAIGIFPKTMGSIHSAFSASFFFLIPMSMLLMGIAVLKSSHKVLGWFTIALAVIGLCPLFIPWPWEGEAIPDMISISAMMAFALVFGIRLLRQTIDTI